VPLILLTFGAAALPAAVLLFAIENFLHFLLGQQMITQRWSIKVVFRSPMIIATILGISVSVMQVTIPEFLRLPIHMLGQVSIPLLLFSLGVRMLAIDFKDWQIGAVGELICHPSRSPYCCYLAPCPPRYSTSSSPNVSTRSHKRLLRSF